VLAAIGVERVEVLRRPRVGVLSTGDELVAAGSPLAPGQIRDANRPSLLALVERAGCEAVDLGVAPDDEEAITEAVTLGSERCDAVVVSGGVSVGDADLVKVVLGRLCEGTMHWMQIAIKPAKPFAFGVATASATPIFGVPGNPVSAMVSFELLVRPALNQLAGRPAFGAPQLSAVADEPLERVRDGKTHFLRVIAEAGADGRIHVRSSGVQASHVLSAMAAANALAEVPDGTGIGAGEQVDILLLEADALAAASRRTAAVARR
jgi:molybdenum cofactor synthesis domain-containing protein